MPSHQLAVSFRIISCLGAAVWVIRALLYYAQSRTEPTVTVTGFGTVTIEGSNADALGIASLIGFGLVVALIAVDLLWRRERRPKDALQAYGEAYVELPLTWVYPLRYRMVLGVGVGLAVAAGMQGSLHDVTMFTGPAAIQDAYRWSAISALGWAVVWVAGAALPGLCERSHQRRLEWSAWYRLRPGSVAFVAPLREDDFGESAGIGWVLRTAGLVLAVLVGLILVLAGVGVAGEGDTAGGLFWLLLGGVIGVFPIRAFVRRRAPRNIRKGF